MSMQLDKIMEAEKKVQKDIEKANLKKEQLIEIAIENATEEANRIHQETETKIQQLLEDKKQRLQEIDEKLQNVVKLENEKIVNKVTKKVTQIAKDIYKEAVGND